MILSTENSALAPRIGERKAIELYAKVGFDAIDYGFTPMLERGEMEWNRNTFRLYADEVNQIANDNGIFFNQAHGPLLFHFEFLPDFSKEILPLNIRSLECCSLLGIPHMVVHPIHNIPGIHSYNDLWNINLEYFNLLLPYAKEFNVKLALENMFRYDKKRGTLTGSFLSNSEEYIRFYEALNDPFILCLVDTGHCTFTDETPGDMIRKLANRVKGLHINDNLFRTDDHLVPGAGLIDWNDVMKALAEINYTGDMTLEVLWPYRAFDDSFLEPATKYMHDVGRYLIRKFEEFSLTNEKNPGDEAK